MPRPAKTAPTYSHVGSRPEVGYEHRGRKNSHHSLRDAGKAHALTVTARGQYESLCGVAVPRYSDTAYGDGSTTGHVASAGDQGGAGVCCGRCRKLLGLQAYAVQFRDAGRNWRTVLGGKFPTRSAANGFRLAQSRGYLGAVEFRVRLV